MKLTYLIPAIVAIALVAFALFQPTVAKAVGERVHDALFSHMARSGLVLGMAEINSRQKTAIAAGQKVLNSVHGTPKCLVFTSPAAAAWAQNDTFASGLKIPAGSRLLNSSIVSHGAMAASVTVDVGLRNFATGAVVAVDGIADAVTVAAAGRTAINNGTLVAAGIDSVTTVDTEPYVTIEGANPTDDIQMRFEIWYLPPG